MYKVEEIRDGTRNNNCIGLEEIIGNKDNKGLPNNILYLPLSEFPTSSELFRYEPINRNFRKLPFSPRIEVFSAFKRPFATNGNEIVSKDAEMAAACCACTACTACR